jgi:hypothetical protein
MNSWLGGLLATVRETPQVPVDALLQRLLNLQTPDETKKVLAQLVPASETEAKVKEKKKNNRRKIL